jgi:hypothetical protein
VCHLVPLLGSEPRHHEVRQTVCQIRISWPSGTPLIIRPGLPSSTFCSPKCAPRERLRLFDAVRVRAGTSSSGEQALAASHWPHVQYARPVCRVSAIERPRSWRAAADDPLPSLGHSGVIALPRIGERLLERSSQLKGDCRSSGKAASFQGKGDHIEYDSVATATTDWSRFEISHAADGHQCQAWYGYGES